jgi:hypothetical protein
MPEWLAILLPGLGTTLIAIVSGAGGSALLELYYKPRRDRRRAAAILYSEILHNAQFLRSHIAFRVQKPREIPQDFKLSRLGFDAVTAQATELPVPVVRRLIKLYNQIDGLNQQVQAHNHSLEAFFALERDSPLRERMNRDLNTMVDVFQTGVDNTLQSCADLEPRLRRLASVRDSGDPGKEFEPKERVEELIRGREQRLKIMEEWDELPPESNVVR